MTAPFHKTDHYSPAPQYTMPNNTLDRAIEAVILSTALNFHTISRTNRHNHLDSHTS